ncbi:MAG: GH3 auxin-responsive promoter family protein [Candidatus Bathyarchaeia archaeon]
MFAEEESAGIFKSILAPWYESLKDPHYAQTHTLTKLVEAYAKTYYGQSHNASSISGIEDFRANFPVIGYNELSPYFAEVQKGNYRAFLPEPLVCWVMTRGSTGHAKVLPATKTHLEQIFACGARALINFALKTKDFELLSGKILNLNFPSSVHKVIINGREITYGYSSGTYAKLNPMLDKVSLLPRQEEIDALGSGITRKDWEKRFELVYKRAVGADVTAAMGVTPVILAFARYVSKKHGKKPKELWKMRALFCTSVRKIQFKYAPVLKKYYGDAPIVEIYSATEGVFAQQIDNLPYVTPNYDAYLFEVETKHKTKMLHELKRGEWGNLIVSTCILPRYNIGDLIEAAGKNYFRVIGRDKPLIRLEHVLYRLFFGWLI